MQVGKLLKRINHDNKTIILMADKGQEIAKDTKQLCFRFSKWQLEEKYHYGSFEVADFGITDNRVYIVYKKQRKI